MMRTVARHTSAFTIVELMIVVAIVAILSLIAIPLYISRAKVGKMSEGITGAGMIRTAFRVYAASHGGKYPVLNAAKGDELGVLSIDSSDLDGKYFKAKDYEVNSTSTTYKIRVTLPTDIDYWYEIDQDGNESKSYY